MQVHPQDPSLISFQSSCSFKSDNKNKYKEKFQKVKEENSKLKGLLEEKDHEICSLNGKIDNLSNSIDSLTLECSAISTAKIVDLSKKNRHLNAELHCAKSKCRDLEKSQENLQKLLKETEEKLEEQKPVEIPVPPPNEFQILNDKYEKAAKRIFEILNQNTQLKNELKMAHKCLLQEIGENVNIQQILSGTSNWRGRAQQIAILNSKLSELRNKFETSSLGSFDDIPQLPLKRYESMRRLEVETMTKELEECKGQLNEVKQKVVALKTRNRNLSEDANSYKLKTLDLLEKSERDEEFIKCLNDQIAMLKYEHNFKSEEMKKEIERVENLKKEAEVESEKLQCQLINQQELLSDKENDIERLRNVIQELEQSVREMSGDFLFSCRQMNKEEYKTLLKNLEEEKNNLLVYMQQLNDRLDKESVKVSEQQDTIIKQRSKICQLESKIRDLERERDAISARNRRMNRISDYSHSLSSSNLAGPVTKSKEKLTAEIDKYKFKLEVALEKIAFLEKKVQDQSEEKREDCEKFVEIMSRSKELFKNLFDGKENGSGDKSSECPETPLNTTLNSNFS